MINKINMKRIFKANDELAEILENFGFIEVTSDRDKIKGKKLFKFPQRRSKFIYFDYINIRILNRSVYEESIIEMNEEQLKAVLLFFLLTPKDFKEISEDGRFSFKSVKSGLRFIQERISNPRIRTPKKEKLKRIMDVYSSIEL